MKAPERPTFDVRGPDRDNRAWVVSVIVHVALFILISGAVIVPALDFLIPRGEKNVRPEHVTFIQPPPVPKPQRATVQKQPPPADTKKPPDAAAPPTGAAPPTAPPTVIPSGVAPPRRDTLVVGDSTAKGNGRVFGRGEVTALSPGVRDPRLVPGAPTRIDPAGPLAPEYRGADSLVHAWVRAYWDSLAVAQANAGRRPGDWTVDRNGKKFGADQQWIYFGKFKLPTMLLALLPIHTTANPTLVERNRALESMRFEIEFQARRATNEKSFNDAVKELRARKEAEHKAEQAKKK